MSTTISRGLRQLKTSSPLVEEQAYSGTELKGLARIRSRHLLVKVPEVCIDFVLLVRIRDDDRFSRGRHPPVISHPGEVAEVPRQRPVIRTHDRDPRGVARVL